jgi:hypothetical protein
MKWGTDSDDMGHHRSEATLVTAMITEVPHFSQAFCAWEGNKHHFVSIISLPQSGVPTEVGRRSETGGAAFR